LLLNWMSSKFCLMTVNIYISVLTETWLNSDINFDMLHNPGYRMFRLDSHDGRQGGRVAVYVQHFLLSVTRPVP